MSVHVSLEQEWENELRQVLTVREVMSLFYISDPKTVILACATRRLKSRKADAAYGEKGGVWLIDADAAFKLWGHRRDKTS